MQSLNKKVFAVKVDSAETETFDFARINFTTVSAENPFGGKEREK